MEQSQRKAWDLFLQSGSVESYLKYSATKKQSGDVVNAADGKRNCDKRE